MAGKGKTKLTPKQQRFVRAIYAVKLAALRRLIDHLAIQVEPSQETQQLVATAILVLLSPTDPLCKEAAAMILDVCWPTWRDEADAELVGEGTRRDDPAVRRWSREIIARDGSCRRCGSTRELNAHHVVPWATAPRLRLDLDNGAVLCGPCHRGLHSGSWSWPGN